MKEPCPAQVSITVYKEALKKYCIKNLFFQKRSRTFAADLRKSIYRGVEQLVARWAHNPKVVCSSQASATKSPETEKEPNTAEWSSW